MKETEVPAEFSNLDGIQGHSVKFSSKQFRPHFTELQMEFICLGFLPKSKDDKWIMLFIAKKRRLYIYDHVTRVCMFEAVFISDFYGPGAVIFNIRAISLAMIKNISVMEQVLKLINQFLVPHSHIAPPLMPWEFQWYEETTDNLNSSKPDHILGSD